MTGPKDHAEYGRRAIEHGTPDYGSNHASGDEETNVVDALANVMHYCTQQGINFASCVATAEGHHSAEQLDDIDPDNDSR